MGTLGKRVKNMVKANLNEGVPATPSIKSVTDTRVDLVKRYEQEIQSRENLKGKLAEYGQLISEWDIRISRATSTKEKAPANTPAVAFEELQIVLDTATEQKRQYSIARVQAEENIQAKGENIQKMKASIDQLYAYERKYALRASLERTSAELNSAVDPVVQQNESRQITLAIHVAQALLELKEGEVFRG